MVSEIRIYVEGGGDGSETKKWVRQGFSNFLKDLVTKARSQKIKWQIIACGSRNVAYRSFMIALDQHQDAFNVLLVDSEGPVTLQPWEHLGQRDHWDSHGADETQCHLMVQMMETWFIADVDSLKRFYGRGFNANAIPGNLDVEKIPKEQIESAMKTATRGTTKGEYHKTLHAPKLLERLDVSKVRKVAHHCNRLFTILEEKMT